MHTLRSRNHRRELHARLQEAADAAARRAARGSATLTVQVQHGRLYKCSIAVPKPTCRVYALRQTTCTSPVRNTLLRTLRMPPSLCPLPTTVLFLFRFPLLQTTAPTLPPSLATLLERTWPAGNSNSDGDGSGSGRSDTGGLPWRDARGLMTAHGLQVAEAAGGSAVSEQDVRQQVAGAFGPLLERAAARHRALMAAGGGGGGAAGGTAAAGRGGVDWGSSGVVVFRETLTLDASSAYKDGSHDARWGSRACVAGGPYSTTRPVLRKCVGFLVLSFDALGLTTTHVPGTSAHPAPRTRHPAPTARRGRSACT